LRSRKPRAGGRFSGAVLSRLLPVALGGSGADRSRQEQQDARRVQRASASAAPGRRVFDRAAEPLRKARIAHRAKRGRASARWPRWPQIGRAAHEGQAAAVSATAAQRKPGEARGAPRPRIDPLPRVSATAKIDLVAKRVARPPPKPESESKPQQNQPHQPLCNTEPLAAILTLRLRPETVDVSRRRSLMQRDGPQQRGSCPPWRDWRSACSAQS